MKKTTLVLFFLFLLIACGKKPDEATDTTVTPSNSTVSDSKGNVIAYFLGFATNIDTFRYKQPTASSYAFLMIKKTSEIVEVDLSTGLYVADRIVCSDQHCEEKHYSMGNVLANQIIYVGQFGYFKATGKPLTISVKMCLDKNSTYLSDGCVLETHGTLLKEVSRPYDFTPLAPIKITAAGSDKDDDDDHDHKGDDHESKD